MTRLRRIVRWSLLILLVGRLILAVLLVSGVAVPALVLRAMEASIVVSVAAFVPFFVGDGKFPPALRRLIVHEALLFTSCVRWISRRGPQGVREGDLVVRYAAAQAFVVAALLFASVVETVALALVIPWPAVKNVVLVIDLWGVYFVIALQISCVVRPHIVRADGSLALRYGVLTEIVVPASQIARVRVENRLDRGGPVKLNPDGSLDMGIGGQTTVTVELSDSVPFVRPLGKCGQARLLRFYADSPAAAVAGLARGVGGEGSEAPHTAC